MSRAAECTTPASKVQVAATSSGRRASDTGRAKASASLGDAWRNKPGGYYVASSDPTVVVESAARAVVQTRLA